MHFTVYDIIDIKQKFLVYVTLAVSSQAIMQNYESLLVLRPISLTKISFI